MPNLAGTTPAGRRRCTPHFAVSFAMRMPVSAKDARRKKFDAKHQPRLHPSAVFNIVCCSCGHAGQRLVKPCKMQPSTSPHLRQNSLSLSRCETLAHHKPGGGAMPKGQAPVSTSGVELNFTPELSNLPTSTFMGSSPGWTSATGTPGHQTPGGQCAGFANCQTSAGNSTPWMRLLAARVLAWGSRAGGEIMLHPSRTSPLTFVWRTEASTASPRARSCDREKLS